MYLSYWVRPAALFHPFCPSDLPAWSGLTWVVLFPLTSAYVTSSLCLQASPTLKDIFACVLLSKQNQRIYRTGPVEPGWWIGFCFLDYDLDCRMFLFITSMECSLMYGTHDCVWPSLLLACVLLTHVSPLFSSCYWCSLPGGTEVWWWLWRGISWRSSFWTMGTRNGCPTTWFNPLTPPSSM